MGYMICHENGYNIRHELIIISLSLTTLSKCHEDYDTVFEMILLLCKYVILSF